MKARIIKEKRENIENDIRNGGRIMIVKSVSDERNECKGFIIYSGESIGNNVHFKNTMVITELGFENQDTILVLDNKLQETDNIFCCDETSIRFVNRVINASKTIDISDIEIVRYY